MIHDSYVVLVTEPRSINRPLNDGMAVCPMIFSSIFSLLLGLRYEGPASSKATATVTNRIDKIHISEQCLGPCCIGTYATRRMTRVEAVHMFDKRRNPRFYASA
jgi:hypothetical protein